jgi:type II secretory ATPase GspE/PulE/Tfp pilus assembly ATPase PilB-like protein
MGAEPYLVASALRCVISQRLVRNICQHCREDYEAPSELVAKLDGPWSLPEPPIRLWRGKGCRYCFNTGYRGRTVVSELLNVDEAVRAKIVTRATSEEIAEVAVQKGMKPMYWDGVEKVLKGISTLEEVLDVAEDLAL